MINDGLSDPFKIRVRPRLRHFKEYHLWSIATLGIAELFVVFAVIKKTTASFLLKKSYMNYKLNKTNKRYAIPFYD